MIYIFKGMIGLKSHIWWLNENSFIPSPIGGGPGWGLIISGDYFSLPPPLPLGGAFSFSHYISENVLRDSYQTPKKLFTG